MNKVVSTHSFDELLDALAHVQRRKLLTAMLEANHQDDAPAVIGDRQDEMEALVSMHHVHLPKLEEYGFIIWDRDTHEVRTGPQFDEIKPLLELLDAHADELPSDWL